MIGVTKIELFTGNRNGEFFLERSRDCTTGKIFVRWSHYEGDIYCAEFNLNSLGGEGWYFTGNYYKRVKLYFENGYVWDTELKPLDDWRRMIYEELNKYVDSGYEELPGEHQSEMSRAARLLDDEMQYEI